MNRLRQMLRTNTLTGHFWKWKLGDGSGCPWCKVCRKVPIVQRVIPYSYEGLDDYKCPSGGMPVSRF